jgi:branched-chain amino acid aminotransferase
MDAKVREELSRLAAKGRVFLSMPWIPDLSPACLDLPGRFEVADTDEPWERRHAILKFNEAGLSPLDHGGLYGDACFEGILIKNGSVFLFKEHLERWWRSAKLLSIKMPYSMPEMAWHILRTINAVGFDKTERAYLRPVLTRGFGNLGINPKKCLAPTVYVIASTIQLYPAELYDKGIELAVARAVRRPGREFIDPNIKSNNYLNNIFGLLETLSRGAAETLMLTAKGNIAEATADNVFSITRKAGWEADPTKVVLKTPVTAYCLKGITRDRIIANAMALGYTVEERDDMLPMDLVGLDRECFMTGTGCGLMPVVGVEGIKVGDGHPGPVTRKLLDCINGDMANPAMGLPFDATQEELHRYLGIIG